MSTNVGKSIGIFLACFKTPTPYFVYHKDSPKDAAERCSWTKNVLGQHFPLTKRCRSSVSMCYLFGKIFHFYFLLYAWIKWGIVCEEVVKLRPEWHAIIPMPTHKMSISWKHNWSRQLLAHVGFIYESKYVSKGDGWTIMLLLECWSGGMFVDCDWRMSAIDSWPRFDMMVKYDQLELHQEEGFGRPIRTVNLELEVRLFGMCVASQTQNKGPTNNLSLKFWPSRVRQPREPSFYIHVKRPIDILSFLSSINIWPIKATSKNCSGKQAYILIAPLYY